MRIRSGICRDAKGGGVEQRETGKSVGLGQRGPHANGAPPIVRHERDRVQVESANQSRQIVDVLSEAIGIMLRLVAQSAADVVDGDHAIVLPPAADQLAPIERPGRIAVDQQQHFALPLVEVMIAPAVQPQLVRGKGIQRTPIDVGHRKIAKTVPIKRQSPRSASPALAAGDVPRLAQCGEKAAFSPCPAGTTFRGKLFVGQCMVTTRWPWRVCPPWLDVDRETATRATTPSRLVGAQHGGAAADGAFRQARGKLRWRWWAAKVRHCAMSAAPSTLIRNRNG